MEPGKQSRLAKEIQDCNTIPEMVAVLNKYYNLDNFKLSLLYKAILIKHLFRIISLLNPKERT